MNGMHNSTDTKKKARRVRLSLDTVPVLIRLELDCEPEVCNLHVILFSEQAIPGG